MIRTIISSNILERKNTLNSIPAFGSSLNTKLGSTVDQFIQESVNSGKKLLTTEEEKSLAQKALNGDISAKNKLIEFNKALVDYVLKRVLKRKQASEELQSAGTFGLVKAASGFEPGKGVKFATYACKCIIDAIKHEERNAAMLPDNRANVARIASSFEDYITQQKQRPPKVADYLEYVNIKLTQEEIKDLTKQLGRTPTESELEKLKELDLANMLNYQSGMQSLNVPSREHKGQMLFELIPSPESTEFTPATHFNIKEQADVLTPDELFVLTKKYGLDDKGVFSAKELGRQLSVASAQITNIEKEAIAKLRLKYASTLEKTSQSPQMSSVAKAVNYKSYTVSDAKKDLAKHKELLNDLETTIMIKRYGLDGDAPMSLRKLGEALKMSYENVRKIEKFAIEKMCRAN